MKPIKKVALLHSLCSVGKASLTNMIPVLSKMGIEACPIPTVMLSTHTGGYGLPARQVIDSDYIRNAADHYRANQVSFDMIFIGYLGNLEMVSAIQYFIEQFPTATIVLDPIMGDHGTFYSNLDASYGKVFQTLFPYTHTLLPNLTEACILTDTPYREDFSEQQLQTICDKLHASGIRTVIMTSAEKSETTRKVAISIDGTFKIYDLPSEPFEFHGSGDAFDAVLMGTYLRGQTWGDGVEAAHRFVHACIQTSSQYDYPEREGLCIEKSLSLLV